MNKYCFYLFTIIVTVQLILFEKTIFELRSDGEPVRIHV